VIPVNEPLLDGNEKKYLCECIETKWISSEGPFVKRLEQGLANFTGRKYAVAVANGSLALDLAAEALSLEPGAEVILPAFTIISCANAVIRAGCKPVLVDCDLHTWNMIPRDVEAAITTRTRAIMVVHIYGLAVDMDPILALAKKHGLRVIEDAAELIGQTYKGRPCGSFGDISTFSFYPNKHITTGEGGMILTDDLDLAERARSLRNLCFGPRRFIHEHLGWNARMSNLQAAVGVAQLERIGDFIRLKRKIGGEYHRQLRSMPGLQLPLERTEHSENIYWVFGVVLGESFSVDADTAILKLKNRGIECRPFFWPMHRQPVFRAMGLFGGASLPHSEFLGKRGFYLPSGLALSAEQQTKVIRAVREEIFENA